MQGFLVYPKYPYCTLTFLHEISTVEEGKDAIRVNQKALLICAGVSHFITSQKVLSMFIQVSRVSLAIDMLIHLIEPPPLETAVLSRQRKKAFLSWGRGRGVSCQWLTFHTIRATM